jgi:hypothetical protein
MGGCNFLWVRPRVLDGPVKGEEVTGKSEPIHNAHQWNRSDQVIVAAARIDGNGRA